jgi:hypothetical protein
MKSPSIALELETALAAGDPINSILLLHQDANKELRYYDIEDALRYVISNARQFDPYPLDYCNLLYQSLSASERQKMRNVVSKRATDLSSSPLCLIGTRIELAQWLVETVGYNVNQALDWKEVANTPPTPLSRAAAGLKEWPNRSAWRLGLCKKYEEVCIFLLEHGAIPANNDEFQYLCSPNNSPLYQAVYAGNKRIVQLLLEKYHVRPCPTETDCAISRKWPAILSLLFQYGGDDARVVYRSRCLDIKKVYCLHDHHYRRGYKTVLNEPRMLPQHALHPYRMQGRYALVNTCRVLVHHAKNTTNNRDDDTTELLLSSIVDETDPQSVQAYITAGVDPQMALCHAALAKKQLDVCGHYFANTDRPPPLPDPLLVCQWLVELGADPFSVQNRSNSSSSSSNNYASSSPAGSWSPFQLAATCSSDPGEKSMYIRYMTPFQAITADAMFLDETKMHKLRYFLKVWNERFAASNNNNKDLCGDSPIHALCRYPQVSLPAIQLLVQEFDAIVSEPTTAGTTTTTTAAANNSVAVVLAVAVTVWAMVAVTTSIILRLVYFFYHFTWQSCLVPSWMSFITCCGSTQTR